MDWPVPSLKARQRFGFVPAPYAGVGDPQRASFEAHGVSESLAPICAVGKHFGRLVRQSIGAGLAVIDIGRGDRDFLNQSCVGVGAHVSLEPMDRRPSLTLDPTRLTILFARGGDDGRSTSVPVLTRIALDLS